VRVGWVSAWRNGAHVHWETFVAPSDPRIAAARATQEGRIFEWFASGQTVGEVKEGASGDVVELDDLRFGFPGRPEQGLWGIRLALDAKGQPTGAVERFNRPLPASAGSLVQRIFREAFLN